MTYGSSRDMYVVYIHILYIYIIYNDFTKYIYNINEDMFIIYTVYSVFYICYIYHIFFNLYYIYKYIYKMRIYIYIYRISPLIRSSYYEIPMRAIYADLLSVDVYLNNQETIPCVGIIYIYIYI